MNTHTRRYSARRILSSSERQGLEDVVAQEKAMKTETADFYPGQQVGRQDSEQVKRVKKVLRDGEADGLGKHERAAKEKRAGELKVWLQKNMVPQSHVCMRPTKDGVQNWEFRKARDAMSRVEMSAEFQGAATEYKNIMRELGREDEANLELIRP